MERCIFGRPLSVCLSCQSVCNVSVLLPNGWMDQDKTLHGGRPRPRPHCVRWGPSSTSPKWGHSSPPLFSPCLLWPNGSIDQDATWYGDRAWSRPHCVRWRPICPQKGTQPPIFAHVCCGQMVGWIKMPLCMNVDLGPRDIMFDVDPAPHPPKKGGCSPQFLAHVCCGQMVAHLSYC